MSNVPYSTLKVMKENVLRILLVGYESGDDHRAPVILIHTYAIARRCFGEGGPGSCSGTGAFIPGNSICGCGCVVPPSPEPDAGGGAIAAGRVGATEAPTRNPVDVREIAANNKNPMDFASPVIVARDGGHADLRSTLRVIYLPYDFAAASNWYC